MGKSSPSPPPPPDPAATAAAQGAANKESAIASAQINQTNQVTPWGTLSYAQRGTTAEGVPQYTATTTLAPEQQALLDQTNAAALKYGQTANTQMDAVRQRLEQPLDFNTLGPAPVANEATRRATADAMYQRMNPQLERDRAGLETRLANQGITMGSEAWRSGMDDFNRQVNDARLAIDSQSGNEMARMFGLESTARDKAINETVMGRTQPLNELAAMLTGSQVQGPQFVNTPQTNIAPADIMGATYGSYNGQMQGYNAQQQRAAANTQGLYGLLGSGAMGAGMYFSDRRLKRGIVKVGRLGNGLNLYRFKYLWSKKEHIGLMADEVKLLKPWAVKSFLGFDMVDYAEAMQ